MNDDGCAAFRVGNSVGLQFHPEMTSALLRDWLTLGAPTGVDAGRLQEETARHEQRAAVDVRRLLSAMG